MNPFPQGYGSDPNEVSKPRYLIDLADSGSQHSAQLPMQVQYAGVQPRQIENVPIASKPRTILHDIQLQPVSQAIPQQMNMVNSSQTPPLQQRFTVSQPQISNKPYPGWKMIDEGAYWPCKCLPLITISEAKYAPPARAPEQEGSRQAQTFVATQPSQPASVPQQQHIQYVPPSPPSLQIMNNPVPPPPMADPSVARNFGSSSQSQYYTASIQPLQPVQQVQQIQVPVQVPMHVPVQAQNVQVYPQPQPSVQVFMRPQPAMQLTRVMAPAPRIIAAPPTMYQTVQSIQHFQPVGGAFPMPGSARPMSGSATPFSGSALPFSNNDSNYAPITGPMPYMGPGPSITRNYGQNQGYDAQGYYEEGSSGEAL